jgi:RNA polymerase sigma factor (sigma-70 family)
LFKDPDDFRRQYALIPRHRIRSWIWKYTNSRAPLKELVHEVNARIAVLGWQRIVKIDSLESYVKGICRNVAVDWVRDRQEIRTTRSNKAVDDIRHPTDNPETDAVVGQHLERLQRVLNDLPKKLGRVFVYRKFFGYSDEEIAGLMSLDKREVQNTLRKAMHRIDAAMSEAGGKDSMRPDDCHLGFEEDL